MRCSPLLDRLTDHDQTQGRGPGRALVLSRSQLRASVLRDLTWLFNSTNLSSSVDLSAIRSPLSRPELRSDRAGRQPGRRPRVRRSRADPQEAILRFEPRFLPNTLSVRGIPAKDPMGHHNVLSLEIMGELGRSPIRSNS